MPVAAALALALNLAAAPQDAPLAATAQPPAGMHFETETDSTLSTLGVLLFGLSYLTGAVSGLVGGAFVGLPTGDYSLLYLLVPVAGPFFPVFTPHNIQFEAQWWPWIIFSAIDGVAQLAGTAMWIYALASPRKILVRDPEPPPSPVPDIVPNLFGAPGLTLHWRF